LISRKEDKSFLFSLSNIRCVQSSNSIFSYHFSLSFSINFDRYEPFLNICFAKFIPSVFCCVCFVILCCLLLLELFKVIDDFGF